MHHPSTKTVARLPHRKMLSKNNASLKHPATDRRSDRKKELEGKKIFMVYDGIERHLFYNPCKI
jgi:hypothetical protein